MSEAEAASQRPRCSRAKGVELEGLLVEFFDVLTRVDYGEKGRKSAVQPNAVLGAATLLRVLRSLQQNLFFRGSS